jgi:hypothetical protein
MAVAPPYSGKYASFRLLVGVTANVWRVTYDSKARKWHQNGGQSVALCREMSACVALCRLVGKSFLKKELTTKAQRRKERSTVTDRRYSQITAAPPYQRVFGGTPNAATAPSGVAPVAVPGMSVQPLIFAYIRLFPLTGKIIFKSWDGMGLAGRTGQVVGSRGGGATLPGRRGGAAIRPSARICSHLLAWRKIIFMGAEGSVKPVAWLILRLQFGRRAVTMAANPLNPLSRSANH